MGEGHRKRAGIKGSITVETAAVLPFFVAILVFVLFFFRILQVQTGVGQALHYAGRRLAAECSIKSNENAGLPEGIGAEALFQKALKKQPCPLQYVQGGIWGVSLLQSQLSGDYVELKASYRMKLPIRLFGNINYRLAQSVKCRKWTGYHPGQDDEKEDGWLYYTEYGSVYHTSRSCPYLDLSIHAVPYVQMTSERNASGGKYHTCPYCGKKAAGGMAYITDYGDSYHGSLACSGLKRSVYMIRKSEAKGRPLCSKCGH